MRSGKIGAAVARIVRRRLQTRLLPALPRCLHPSLTCLRGRVGEGGQTGLRSDAGLAAVDRRIEEVRQLWRERRQCLSRGLGAGRARRVLALLGLVALVARIRHPGNMGCGMREEKGLIRCWTGAKNR